MKLKRSSMLSISLEPKMQIDSFRLRFWFKISINIIVTRISSQLKIKVSKQNTVVPLFTSTFLKKSEPAVVAKSMLQ